MPGKPGRLASGLALAAALAVALSLRLYCATTAYCSTFDSATPGLMALNILKGERPLFFYGQDYMGSLEAYVAALLFRIAGPSELTLSLSPILFSLAWIAATFLLFSELGGIAAGLAAALALALPSWDTLWYSVGSYGGYPTAFFCGTLALWLAVRLGRRRPAGWRLWLHALGIGAAAALGVWTNYIVFAYLGVAGLLALAFLWQHRFRPPVLLPFLAAGGVAALGFLPSLGISGIFQASSAGSWHPTLDVILHHAGQLFQRPLRYHLFCPHDDPWLIKWVPLALLGAIGLLYAARVATAEAGAPRRRLLLPLLFAGLFLALYLPHPLAETKAPRYTIPLWTMLVAGFSAAIAAFPAGRARRASWALIAAWLAYYATGNVRTIEEHRLARGERVLDRQAVARQAEAAGLRSVELVGGQIFGYEGQVLSFTAGGRVRFVSCDQERHPPSELAAEADPDKAIGCDSDALPGVTASLDAMQVSYRIIPSPWIRLVHALHVPPAALESVPPAAMRVSLENAAGSAAALTDRTWETTVSGPFTNAAIVIDFEQDTAVSGLWLLDASVKQAGLPGGYTLRCRETNGAERVLQHVEKRIRRSWISGRQVFFKDYYGMLECRFAPVVTRQLRLEVERGQREAKPWQLTEVFVLRAAPAAPPSNPAEEEAAALAEAIRAHGIRFTAADRWLSARLMTRLAAAGGRPPVYPPYNPRVRSTHLRRLLRPQPGLAIAVPRSLTAETAAILEADAAGATDWQRLDFPSYCLFIPGPTLTPATRNLRLFWTGQQLLRSNGGWEEKDARDPLEPR